MTSVTKNAVLPTFERLLTTLRGIGAFLVASLLVAATPPPDRAATPALDLDTFEAETEVGTLRAERVDISYVAPLGDGQAIGITFVDGVGSDAGSREVFVRLYHRELSGAVHGELDAEGRASLTVTRGDLSELEATVELAMTDEGASGTVTLMGTSSTFATTAATGVAGVYEAWGTDDSADTRCQWVVLPDERQWGCVCAPPWSSICCRYLYF